MEEYPEEKTADLNKIRREAVPEFAIDTVKLSLFIGDVWVHIPFAECQTHREYLNWRAKLAELPGINDDLISKFDMTIPHGLPRE